MQRFAYTLLRTLHTTQQEVRVRTMQHAKTLLYKILSWEWIQDFCVPW